MNKKCVLAFSGGLDTSYCAVYLKQQGYDVYSAIVNTGGFTNAELDAIEQKAYSLGLKSHVSIDVTQEYYKQGIRYMIYGNVLKNGNYPLSVSSERIFQARALVNYAKSIGANNIAHGSTGAGNDQVRFDMVFQTLYPGVHILTPIRDQKLSREEEVAFLQNNGIEAQWHKAKYSINQGIWGTSIGGEETLTSDKGLPEDVWPNQLHETTPKTLMLNFEEGEITGVDNREMPAVEAIQKIQEYAAAYAVGRDMHTGDTIVGIKGRIGFEAPAPKIIIEAHRLLEKHTLTKWQLQIKQQISDWYCLFFHEGQFLEPVMRNIEAFLADTQKRVTGKVFLKLHPYRIELTGIESPFDLSQTGAGTYGEVNNDWTAEDAKGFIKITGNSTRLWYKLQSEAQ